MPSFSSPSHRSQPDSEAALTRARALIAAESTALTGVLDLSGLGLQSLPAELWELEHLTTLRLGNRQHGADPWEWDAVPDFARVDEQLFALRAPDSNSIGTPNRFRKREPLPGDGPLLPSLRRLDLYSASTPGFVLQLLGRLPHLTALDLYGISWGQTESRLPAALQGLPALEELRFHGTLTPELVAALPQLHTLQLPGWHHDWAGKIATLAAGLPRLRSLSLRGARLPALAPLVAAFPLLERLNLAAVTLDRAGPPDPALPRHLGMTGAYEPLTDLSPLAALSGLTHLDLSGTGVTDLAFLSALPALRWLRLCDTPVRSLAPLAGLKVLEHLDFSRARTTGTTLLDGLEGATALRTLKCRDIASLEPLAALTTLQHLECQACPALTSLEPLRRSTGLLSLSCPNTPLESLEPLRELRQLTYLDVSGARIPTLEPLSAHRNLLLVNCAANPVPSLEPLRLSTRLRSLQCSGTAIASLEPLREMTALHTLYCSINPIPTLAPLAGLHALRQLRCSRTRIDSLDPIADLPALESVICADNRLTDLPRRLVLRESLRHLSITANPMSAVPGEILNLNRTANGLPALRAHLRDIDSGGAETLSDVKVMVLGNGRIGKTQFCNLLQGRPYDPAADSTHGIMVTRQDLGPDRLHWWDFGGQDLYHGTHTLFLQARAIYIVLWTPQAENTAEHTWHGMTFRNHPLDYWLEMVRAPSSPATGNSYDAFRSDLGDPGESPEPSPLLLVQCRCDTPADDLDPPPARPDLLLRQRELRDAPEIPPNGAAPQETAPRPGFLRTLHHSSATPRGMEQARTALHDAIAALRESQSPVRIGAGRLRVKRRLEDLRAEDALRPPAERQHRLLSRADFDALCLAAGQVSDSALLLAYLHECGTVFHQPGLFDDQIVLDQSWALDAIYTVFHREKCWHQLRARHGRFNARDLHELAWQHDHPLPDQRLFLSMMLSCGICFPIPTGIHVNFARDYTPSHLDTSVMTDYLAPELLPAESEIAGELAALWGNPFDTPPVVLPDAPTPPPLTEEHSLTEQHRWTFPAAALSSATAAALFRQVLSTCSWLHASGPSLYWTTGCLIQDHPNRTRSRLRVSFNYPPAQFSATTTSQSQDLIITLQTRGPGALTLLTQTRKNLKTLFLKNGYAHSSPGRPDGED